MSVQYEPATILIPAYNEENAIEAVIKEIHQTMESANIVHEVLIVDDGSSDRTSEIVKRVGARVIRHIKNRGYGAALKTGIRAAKYENIVITDADGTYPIDKIPHILEELKSADMVIGARIGEKVNIPLIRRGPKWFLRKLAGHVTGEKIPDLNSGLRAFRRECIMQYLPILSEKFSFTTTSTVAMLSDNYHVVFTPINYFQRVGKSKIVPWDFINFTTLVLRLSMLFNPLKVFLPIASLFLFFSFGKFVLDIYFSIERAGGLTWEILKQPTVSTTTLILFLSGMQILLIGMISDGLIRKITQRVPSLYKSHGVLSEDSAKPINGKAAASKEEKSSARSKSS